MMLLQPCSCLDGSRGTTSTLQGGFGTFGSLSGCVRVPTGVRRLLSDQLASRGIGRNELTGSLLVCTCHQGRNDPTTVTYLRGLDHADDAKLAEWRRFRSPKINPFNSPIRVIVEYR